MFNPKQFIKSFAHAVRGARTLIKTEQSFRVQTVVGLVVLVLMTVFPLATFERIAVLFLVAMVLVLEMLNSIFERLVDTFKPRIHPVVGEIKDIMATVVLLASIFAAVIGLIIFVPHFLSLFEALKEVIL
jgi:diacylglycerol kinase